MLSEIFGEGFVVLILLALGVFWIKYNLVDTPRMEREQKERNAREENDRKIKERESIDSDLELITNAKNLLPDFNSSMELLSTKFGGALIAESFGLYYTHTQLIDQVMLYEREQISLPNLQSKTYNQDEVYLLQRIIQKSSPNLYGNQDLDESNYHQFLDEIGVYGIDSYAQEPTVHHLREVVGLHLISTKEEITEERRCYTCKLTEQGEILVKMRDLFKSPFGAFRAPLKKEVGSELCSFVYSALYPKRET
jgi:hypothetical protein